MAVNTNSLMHPEDWSRQSQSSSHIQTTNSSTLEMANELEDHPLTRAYLNNPDHQTQDKEAEAQEEFMKFCHGISERINLNDHQLVLPGSIFDLQYHRSRHTGGMTQAISNIRS